MSTTTARPHTWTDATWLRLTLLGVAVAVVGLLMMGLTMIFGRTTSGGDFRYFGDYVLTAAALPQGVGLLMVTLGFHRLQQGGDGRLGTVGVWIYAVCMTELIIECMASVAAGAELIWGPLYPLCAFGLMVGLALLAAGSWNVGLLPKWMLALWPPLGLVGSFGGVGPIPLVFVVFLVVLSVVVHRARR